MIKRHADWPYPHGDDWKKHAIDLNRTLDEESRARILDFDILTLNNVPWIDVREYGAKGDGSTDDSAAINAAAVAARADADDTVLYVPFGTYACESSLDLTELPHIHIDGYIYAKHAGIGIEVGADAADESSLNQMYCYIRKVVSNQNPPTTGDIGIQINNSKYGYFHIHYVGAFDEAIVLRGYNDAGATGACAYNYLKIGTINVCKHGVVLEPTGTDGWCNVNRVYFYSFFKTIPGGKGYAVNIQQGNGEQPNGNIFHDLVIDDSDYAINLDDGMFNYFYNVYNEGDYLLNASADAYDNMIELIFGEDTVVDASASKSNRVLRKKDGRIYEAKARAYLAADQLNLINNTDTNVTLDTETYDPGNTFNTGIYAYLAPIDGYYQVNAQITYENIIADEQYFCQIAKNGTVVTSAKAQSSSTDSISVVCSDIIYLAATNYIRLVAKAICGVDTVDVSGGATVTFMSVHWLSP